jgi:phage replication-related protein YjqB (UPF0714/DUF867 family)
MPDKYANFSQLSASEPKDSYKIEFRHSSSAVAFIAPHAGKIEPGISEICRHISGHDLTYYLFEGLKPNNNSELHITSSRFDEPQGLATANSAKVVVTLHGQAGEDIFINVGGLAKELGHTIIDRFTDAGYVASRQVNESLQGLDQNNICNRGYAKQGVQLEISRGLRDKLVANADEMDRFSSAVRSALKEHGL